MLKTRKTILLSIFFALMVVCVSLGITCLTVYADNVSGSCGKGVSWSFKDGVLHISGNGEMDDYGDYDDTPWDDADIDDDEIDRIYIDEGVTKVGSYAFEGCTYVKILELPKSLVNIGKKAFYEVGSEHGDNIYIGTLEIIGAGEMAFENSTISGEVRFKDGWTWIGEDAFNNTHVTSVYIGRSWESATWQESGFEDNDYLTDVTLGAGLTWVKKDTFYNCPALKRVEFPESMGEVQNGAFYNCKAIKEVYCRGFLKDIWFGEDNDYVFDCNKFTLYQNSSWLPKYLDGNGNICHCEKGTYQTLTSSVTELDGNWWLVSSDTTIDHTLEVKEWSTIVLQDNCKLTVKGGIHVQSGKNLYIVSESLDAKKMGSLKVTSVPDHCAGIGGRNGEKGASVFICGGKIEVIGGTNGAGIGSGYGGNSNVTIYNGNITAKGGDNGAGIGSGNNGNSNVTIYGGNITATGGTKGTGIGSGYNGYSNANVTIYGGNITAKGGDQGAGIGSGRYGNSTVTIKGGNINATGGDMGAGIGSGWNGNSTITIYDGDINATGGDGGAGIGSGWGGNSTITIYDGDITAKGGGDAQKIGAGVNGKATAKGLGVDFTRVKQGTMVTVNIIKDCEIDDISLFWTLENASSCNLLLNGHTITIKKPFTIGNGDFSLTRGTVKYTGGGTFGNVCGGLYLNQITFDGIECGRLFNVTGSGTGKVKVNDSRFTNCKFNGNGAFYFNQTGDYEVSFINNRFYDCTNDGGTIIYIDDISGSTRSYEYHAKFNMTNCVFDNCRNNGNDGGCIYLNAMYVDIGDLEGKGKNIINNCYAKQYGGAIYDNHTFGYGSFKGFICSNNKSGAAGGAMYLSAGGFHVDDCTFFNNSAGNNAYGGAIYLGGRQCVMTNCYFTENSAYKGGAVYDERDEKSDTAYSKCYFVYDKATCGTANEINVFKSMNGCHLYNSNMDKIFDSDWKNYSSKQTGCSGNTPINFLEYGGGGGDTNPYTISSQKLVYLTYVNTKYVNKSLNSGKFAITADNLIWFAKLTGFTGSIDGRGNNLYLVGTADAIADGGKVTNYKIENRNGTYSIGIGNGTGTLLSSGSIIIICVVGGVALITAGVFIFLHVKKKKKSE